MIEKFLTRTISKGERRALKKWILQDKDNFIFFKNEIRKRSENTLYHHFVGTEAFQKFLVTVEKNQSKKANLGNFFRYAAIFIGLLALGFGTFHFLGPELVPKTVTLGERVEVDPENNIVITLADGTTQVISYDGKKELLDKAGKIVAQKQVGGLDFSNFNGSPKEILVFNEIYVPYGQTFHIILSDGTKVWLNAGTRFKFPQNLNLSSQNRIVYLDGEAFFDVVKDEERPFIVNAENLDVRVLGTKFNVPAYRADGQIATTLVEGSVQVYENSNPDTRILLSPNYQASFTKEIGALTKKKVNPQIYIGWMNNRLVIDELSFEQILRKLERTHNVSIINTVESLNKEIYKGEFENESIESILTTIASSTPFTYTIEKNVITISK